MKKNVLMILTALAFGGCSHYDQTLALGAVAGAATGALIADSTYDHGYSGGYGYHGHSVDPYTGSVYGTPFYGHSGVNCRPTGVNDYGAMGSIACAGY